MCAGAPSLMAAEKGSGVGLSCGALAFSAWSPGVGPQHS